MRLGFRSAAPAAARTHTCTLPLLGTENDGDAGLSLVGARYYDSAVGRFITRDTVLTEKPYCYCEGDPVNATDPSGHDGEGGTLLRKWAQGPVGTVAGGIFAGEGDGTYLNGPSKTLGNGLWTGGGSVLAGGGLFGAGSTIIEGAGAGAAGLAAGTGGAILATGGTVLIVIGIAIVVYAVYHHYNP